MMHFYSIYINPEKKNNDLILVKHGFSFIAAFLNVFWALYHRMWRVFLIAMAFNIVTLSIGSDHLAFVSRIMLILVFGFCSADMMEYELEHKKYSLQNVVLADSEQEAELKFFEKEEKSG